MIGDGSRFVSNSLVNIYCTCFMTEFHCLSVPKDDVEVWLKIHLVKTVWLTVISQRKYIVHSKICFSYNVGLLFSVSLYWICYVFGCMYCKTIVVYLLYDLHSVTQRLPQSMMLLLTPEESWLMPTWITNQMWWHNELSPRLTSIEVIALIEELLIFYNSGLHLCGNETLFPKDD